MNIFLRELKVHRLGLLLWAVGIVALIGAGMGKYAAWESAGESVDQLLASIPRPILAVFGFTDFDLSQASGFFGVLYIYIAVMASVHAVLLGSTLVSKEERDRTSEFLYAKPISRARALTAKLLAGILNIVALNLVTSLASYYLVGLFGSGQSFGADVLVLMLGLLLLQLIFFAVGAMVAGVVRRPKLAPSIAASVMFFTFLIYYLVNLDEDLELLGYLSPFTYFDAAALMADGRLDPARIALSVVIVGLGVFGTYRFYSARDLTV